MNSTEIVVQLPRLHVGQVRRRQLVTAAKARFVVTMCGRRWGKSIDGEEWVEDGAIDGMKCGWFTPTYKYLIEVWDSMTHRLAPITLRADKTEKRIELRGGGLIECWTMDTPDPGRSRKYHRIVIDEAGITRGLLAIWQQSIRPTLTDYAGDAWFYGTPKGRTHDFTQLFAKAGSGDERWLAHRAPTRENPFIPAEEIEAARRDMPEGAYLQEYEGIPADDSANPFGQTAITKCVLTPPEWQYQLSRREPAVWGWDFARAQDWTVGIALDYDGKVCRIERWQGVPWQETAAKVARLSGRRPTVGDSTGIGDAVVEMIQRAGCQMWGYVFSQPSKQKLMQRLAGAIQSQQVRFPDGVIRSELETFAYEYREGGVRYSAPPGLHDDAVMALALAVYGADRIGIKPPALAEIPASEMGSHDPAIVLRTRDGRPPQWVGPEIERRNDDAGYASELPEGI